jgi:hypothetical protein
MLLADVPTMAVSCVVASMAKTSQRADHPGCNCIGGGAHGPYHPTQGGQGEFLIDECPHGPGIGGGLTKK